VGPREQGFIRGPFPREQGFIRGSMPLKLMARQNQLAGVLGEHFSNEIDDQIQKDTFVIGASSSTT
jgi:hypothetical protein